MQITIEQQRGTNCSCNLWSGKREILSPCAPLFCPLSLALRGIWTNNELLLNNQCTNFPGTACRHMLCNEKEITLSSLIISGRGLGELLCVY